MLERRSALAAVLDPAVAVVADPDARNRLGEIRGCALVQVAGFPVSRTAIATAVAGVTGAPCPDRIGMVVRTGPYKVLRTGAEQLWIACKGVTDLDSRLSAAIPSAAGCVTPLSSARTRIYLDGPNARDILAKGIAIDLAPVEFAVDQFVLTGLDHTPILLFRAAEDRYEIWVMRTFARTVWDWLIDAAQEFGVAIVNRPKEGQAS